VIGFKAKRIVRLALKSLVLHTLRSFLTMLGIMLGVCSVIAMLAIGEGASAEAQAQIKKLGSQNIIVRSVEPPADEGGGTTSRVMQYGVTYTDAERIRDTLPNVEVIVPARHVRRRVANGRLRFETEIAGTVPWFAQVTGTEVIEGRFLTATDMSGRANACVLGAGAAKTLFPLGDALGSTVTAGKLRYRVVGVTSAFAKPKSGENGSDGDPNTRVYIPLTTMQSHFGETVIDRSAGSMSMERIQIHQLVVKVETLESVVPTARAIAAILEHGHKKQDYEMIVPLELLESARATQRIFSIVLACIAAMGLLVGGIGIMNITLASVVERTREIGIRRAMGAKQADIVAQFLSETVLMAFVGGCLGVGLGFLAAYAVQRFTDMGTVVTLWSVVLSFGISAAVGLVFGIYPAYRASTMDPIEALRHE